MESMCTVCLTNNRLVQKVSDTRLRKYYKDLIVDFMEYELLPYLPRLCLECASLLSKAVTFKEQAIHSFIILKEVHYKELNKGELLPLKPNSSSKQMINSASQTVKVSPTVDKETSKQINKLKMQNQNLLRLLKRLQRDSHGNNIDKKKKDYDSTSEGHKSPEDQSPSRRHVRSPRSSPDEGKNCDLDNGLKGIKILDVRVLTTEEAERVSKSDEENSSMKNIQTDTLETEAYISKGSNIVMRTEVEIENAGNPSDYESVIEDEDTIEEATLEGPIVVSTQSLKTFEFENILDELESEPMAVDSKVPEPHSDLVLTTEVEIKNADDAPSDCDEDDNCVIADDDPIWNDLDMDIGYAEMAEIKSEAVETKIDPEEWRGREQSATPVTDDLLPDLQTLSDLSDGEGCDAAETAGGDSTEQATTDLSEYCNKSPVVVLKDILKTIDTDQSMLQERKTRRPTLARAWTTKNKEKNGQLTKKDCSNCPHCLFMMKKVQGNFAATKDILSYRYGRLHRKQRHITKPKQAVEVERVKRPYKKRRPKWSVMKSKRWSVLKCKHCNETFESNEDLRRHVFEVIGADASMESVEVCEVVEDMEAPSKAESIGQAPSVAVNEELQVVVEDVFKISVTDGQSGQESELSCNHCEKTFKTQKKLRDHILDIVLSDCNKSLDDLLQK